MHLKNFTIKKRILIQITITKIIIIKLQNIFIRSSYNVNYPAWDNELLSIPTTYTILYFAELTSWSSFHTKSLFEQIVLLELVHPVEHFIPFYTATHRQHCFLQLQNNNCNIFIEAGFEIFVSGIQMLSNIFSHNLYDFNYFLTSF